MQIQNSPINNQANIEGVLQQMRALRSHVNEGAGALTPQQARDVDMSAGTSNVNRPEFGNMLKNAIDSVNSLQQSAAQSSTDFVTGKEKDLIKVMIEGQKASVGFQAMVQVRNRFVSAYQDIMNMPI